MPHVAQLNCDQVEARGSPQHARSPSADERAGDDGSHGFHHKLIGVSARFNLRASDLRAPPCWGDFSWTNFPPTGSLAGWLGRGVAARLICLLLRSQIECVRSGCVNGQKCGAGTWCAGPVKRNFSPSALHCQTSPDSQFISAIMSSVKLLGRGWKLKIFLCYLFARCICEYFPSETT